MAPHNPFAPRPPSMRTGEAPAAESGEMSGVTKALLIAAGVTGAFWVLSRMWESKSEEERLAGQMDELASLGEGEPQSNHPGVVIVMPVAK